MEKERKIVVYTSPDCAYCYNVKGYLQEKGFEFEEIDIYEDEEGYEYMKEISGQENIPVTVIGSDIVIGWDMERLKEILSI